MTTPRRSFWFPVSARLEEARLDSSVTFERAASRQRPRIPEQFWASGLRTIVLLRLEPELTGHPSWTQRLTLISSN